MNDQVSAPVPVEGTQSTSVDEEIASLFKDGWPVWCRYCGAKLTQGSIQFVGYNGGLLRTSPYPGTPHYDEHVKRGLGHLLTSGDYQPPHIYCGCGDACLARDMAAGLAYLKSLEVIE